MTNPATPPFLFTSKDGKRLLLLTNDVQALTEEDWGTTIITADDAYRVTDGFADVAERLGYPSPRTQAMGEHFHVNRWVLRRALAWFCAVVGVGGLYATPARHESLRLYPLVFAAMVLFGAYLAWKDAR